MKLLEAIIKRISPCEHEWDLLNTSKVYLTYNTNFTWLEYTYRCKKCCERKLISTKNN